MPASLDEHAQRVCIAAWISFECEELRAARCISANLNVFAVARLACVPNFDCIQLEHVNSRCGGGGGGSPSAHRKNPEARRRPGSHWE
jgi:hypothetical protein